MSEENPNIEKDLKKLKAIYTVGLILIFFGLLFFKFLFVMIGIGILIYGKRFKKEKPELQGESALKTAKELFATGKGKYDSLNEQQQKYALGGGAAAILLLGIIMFVMGIKSKVTLAVIDQAGAPVSGLELTADGGAFCSSDGTTDDEGNVTFEDLCEEETYSISVSGSTHRISEDFEFTVLGSATLENKLKLEKLGTFTAKTVNFIDGSALANVRVSLSTDSKKEGCESLSGSSGDDGTMSIVGLCAGESYTVEKNKSPILINTPSFIGADAYALAEDLRYVATSAINVKLTGASLSSGMIKATVRPDTMPKNPDFPAAKCSTMSKNVSNSSAIIGLCNGLTYDIYLNEEEHMFKSPVSIKVDGKTTEISGEASKLKQISCVDVLEQKGVRCPDRSFDCLPEKGDYFCFTDLSSFYPEGKSSVNNWERDGIWSNKKDQKAWFFFEKAKKAKKDYEGKPTIRTTNNAAIFLYGDAVKNYEGGSVVGSGYFRKYEQGFIQDDMHIEVETLLTNSQIRKYEGLKSFAVLLQQPNSLKVQQTNALAAEELYLEYLRTAKSYTASANSIDDALKFILFSNRTSADTLKQSHDAARERRLNKGNFSCTYTTDDANKYCKGSESCPIKEGQSYDCAKDYAALFDVSNPDGFFWATETDAQNELEKLVLFATPKAAAQKDHAKKISKGDAVIIVKEFSSNKIGFDTYNVAPAKLGSKNLRYAIGYLKAFSNNTATIEYVKDISNADYTRANAVINLRTQLAKLENGKPLRHFGSRLESFYFAHQEALSVLSEDELAAVLLIAGADAALTEKAVSAIKERHSKELEHVTSMQTEIKTLWKEDSFMKPYLLSADNNAESKSTIDRFPIQKPTEPRGKSSIESKAEPYLPTNGKCDSSLKDKELGKIAQALIYRSEGSVKEAKVTNGKVSVTIPVTDSVSAPSVKVETDCYRQGTCGTCSNHNDCSGWTCGCSESRCTSWGTCTGCPTQCTKSYSWRVKDYTTSFKADISESDASNLRFELLYSKVKNYCHPEVSSDKMFIKPVGLRVTSGGSNIYSTSINAPSDAAALKTLGLDDASVHISIKE